MVDGNHFTVNFSAYALAADSRVYLESEVQRRRACGKLYHVAARCENEYLRCKQIHLHRLEEVFRIVDILLPLERLSEPGQLYVVAGSLARHLAFFVFPVCGDTVFGDFVHLVSPYLYLERLSVIAYDCGVQRLIHVWLRHGDVVLEPAGNRLPHGVDDAQNGVAVLDSVDDDPDRYQVKDLIYLLILELHLPVYTVKMLCSAVNIVMKVHIVKRFLYLFDDRIYGFFPLALSQTYLLFQLFEFLRVKIFEGYVLQLEFYG